MDVLSQIIALLQPQALLWKVVEAHGDWALRFPGDDHVVFGQVIAGACRLELSGRPPLPACSGDFLLMTAPASWVLRGDGDADPLDFEAVQAGSSATPRSISAGRASSSPGAKAWRTPIISTRSTRTERG